MIQILSYCLSDFDYYKGWFKQQNKKIGNKHLEKFWNVYRRAKLNKFKTNSSDIIYYLTQAKICVQILVFFFHILSLILVFKMRRKKRRKLLNERKREGDDEEKEENWMISDQPCVLLFGFNFNLK